MSVSCGNCISLSWPASIRRAHKLGPFQNYTLEKFQKGDFKSLWQHIKCDPSTLRGALWKPNNHRLFWICSFVDGLDENDICILFIIIIIIIIIIIYEKRRIQHVFCLHSNSKPAYLVSSRLKSVSQKLRFWSWRFRMGERPNCRKKALFLNSSGEVRMGPHAPPWYKEEGMKPILWGFRLKR